MVSRYTGNPGGNPGRSQQDRRAAPGLAAAALRGALLHATGDEGWVVRLVESPAPASGDEVVAELVAGRPASLGQAAAHLNRCDVAIIQHEYGSYGGHDGAEILSLLDQIGVPGIVVPHTVLSGPTPHQRALAALGEHIWAADRDDQFAASLRTIIAGLQAPRT